jgi:hypothetical protein
MVAPKRIPSAASYFRMAARTSELISGHCSLGTRFNSGLNGARLLQLPDLLGQAWPCPRDGFHFFLDLGNPALLERFGKTALTGEAAWIGAAGRQQRTSQVTMYDTNRGYDVRLTCGPHTAKQARAPGFRTRRNSPRAHSTSAKNTTPKRHVARSNLLSAKARDCASDGWVVKLGTPRSRARSTAI